MSLFKTEQIADFALAFTTAFELLEEYRVQRKGIIDNLIKKIVLQHFILQVLCAIKQ